MSAWPGVETNNAPPPAHLQVPLYLFSPTHEPQPFTAFLTADSSLQFSIRPTAGLLPPRPLPGDRNRPPPALFVSFHCRDILRVQKGTLHVRTDGAHYIYTVTGQIPGGRPALELSKASTFESLWRRVRAAAWCSTAALTKPSMLCPYAYQVTNPNPGPDAHRTPQGTGRPRATRTSTTTWGPPSPTCGSCPRRAARTSTTCAATSRRRRRTRSGATRTRGAPRVPSAAAAAQVRSRGSLFCGIAAHVGLCDCAMLLTTRPCLRVTYLVQACLLPNLERLSTLHLRRQQSGEPCGQRSVHSHVRRRLWRRRRLLRKRLRQQYLAGRWRWQLCSIRPPR